MRSNKLPDWVYPGQAGKVSEGPPEKTKSIKMYTGRGVGLRSPQLGQEGAGTTAKSCSLLIAKTFKTF